MNADFEMELASAPGTYRRPDSFEAINRRLAAHLLWLAEEGDAILLDEPFAEATGDEAMRRGVELISTQRIDSYRKQVKAAQAARVFTPWGWTESAIAIGKRTGTLVQPVPLDVVARVNSKLWSHALEQELGIALPGAHAAATFDELKDAVARTCPGANDKWVIKSPFGFAARERVLGRGGLLEGASATWVRRRLARGETLIFQPWLDVTREYGVCLYIHDNGQIEFVGISDLQTNGAGTGIGYVLGRRADAGRVATLKQIAAIVGKHLWAEGYTGAAGFDALEHAGGLHPLLEVNARYTMGFVALAVERALAPQTPMFWSTK